MRKVGAVVLAAGLSRRMGEPKMVLPWGKWTVIEQVTWTLSDAGVEEIIVVTGGARDQVEQVLAGSPARVVFNPHFAQGEMLSSLLVGMAALSQDVKAALVALGDQPRIEVSVVNRLLQTARETRAILIVPSYQRRRGHPWLVDRRLWPELFALRSDQTMRDFLNDHAREIVYVEVDTPAVLKDLDTPEDYHSQKPE